MSSSDSDVCSSVADSSDSSEYMFESQYLPYEGKPLAPLGEDITDVNSQQTTEEADLDGLTPTMLELRYDRKNKVDSWYITCLQLCHTVVDCLVKELHRKIDFILNSIRFYKCKCGKCSDQNLLGSLEVRCCHEITEALGKLTFDGSIENISCVTLHEDFGALTNETVLSQVGPLLKDRKGRSYRCRSGMPFKE